MAGRGGTESASVPGDVVISECMILQCWLVHLLFACLSRVDANTFKPLGTPLQQPRKCIFHWILQSNMAWMPWNVHYFLLESYKAYSFTLFKAVDFAISTINILIIDVNLAHIYIYIKKKNKSKNGWFVPTRGAFIEETFTVWTVFSPDPQGRSRSSPVVLFSSSCSTAAGTLVPVFFVVFFFNPQSNLTHCFNTWDLFYCILNNRLSEAMLENRGVKLFNFCWSQKGREKC